MFLSVSEIISKSKLTHSIEYDYSKVVDSKLSDNITIICPIHEEFHPRLSRFLRGSNCPKCIGKCKKDIYQFITDSNKIHGNFYSYDKFNYRHSHIPSIVTCPIHGDFLISPTNHIHNKCGCPKCAIEKAKRVLSSTTEEFITKAKSIHRGKYDYSKVEYINNHTNITIICPNHGEFTITPNNHLRGRGCPVCKESHLEREIRNFLLENNIEFEYQKKFDWLGKQSLDFYLPKYNLGIECQGKQHFGEGNWNNSFNDIIESDIRKYNLCKENNVNLIYYTKADYKLTNSIYNKKNTFLDLNNLLKYLK